MHPWYGSGGIKATVSSSNRQISRWTSTATRLTKSIVAQFSLRKQLKYYIIMSSNLKL